MPFGLLIYNFMASFNIPPKRRMHVTQYMVFLFLAGYFSTEALLEEKEISKLGKTQKYDITYYVTSVVSLVCEHKWRHS